MGKEKKLTLEELFKDSNSENPQKEFDWGKDVGRERIWSMSDEDYQNEYGKK